MGDKANRGGTPEHKVFGEAIGDPVEIAAYDGSWVRRFEELKGKLLAALGPAALRVDHVGSTSVPLLPAKPVIDVQVSVADLENEDAYRPAIESLGLPLRSRDPWLRFFRQPKGERRTSHVHVVQAGGEEEQKVLLFVAYLRAHPERRDAYAALKRDLARRFRDRRGEYTRGKGPFIQETIRLAEAEPRDERSDA